MPFWTDRLTRALPRPAGGKETVTLEDQKILDSPGQLRPYLVVISDTSIKIVDVNLSAPPQGGK